MVAIGRFYETGELPPFEQECCPNCGFTLRARNKQLMRALDILQTWFADHSAGAA
jgi:hypothetical protein